MAHEFYEKMRIQFRSQQLGALYNIKDKARNHHQIQDEAHENGTIGNSEQDAHNDNGNSDDERSYNQSIREH